MSDKVTKTNQEWLDCLTAEEYNICRQHGTEPPFSGEYVHCDKNGIYHCKCCEYPLFDSNAKFDSGSGWPSFYKAINADSVYEVIDNSHSMIRTEVRCPQCDAHLGHVFSDGPQPTGLRYCINSAALKLKEE